MSAAYTSTAHLHHSCFVNYTYLCLHHTALPDRVLTSAGTQLTSAQLFPVSAPYFYMATQPEQTCQDVCSFGGVTNMTSYFFTGFYDNQPSNLCAVSIDGVWVTGSQPAGATTCSVLLDHSADMLTPGLACACMSTSESVGLANPNTFSNCADACYNSPYGQGAAIPGARSSYACIATENVGISNAFGNIAQNSTTGTDMCLTASLTGGAGTSDSSYSCACVFPTAFRRKLQVHRKYASASVASV